MELRGKSLIGSNLTCKIVSSVARLMGTFPAWNQLNTGFLKVLALGLYFLLIYINDLPLSLMFGEVSIYADDTSISYSSDSVTNVKDSVNEDLDHLKNLLESNKSCSKNDRAETAHACAKARNFESP